MGLTETKISVVVPVFNEEEVVRDLYEAVSAVLDGFAPGSEILIVDDGSTDKTGAIIEGLSAGDDRLKVLRFDVNMGQCKALEKGFREATCDIIISLDGDMQDAPEDIPLLVGKMEEGYDLVCGWRYDRHDKWHKRVKSRFGNYIMRNTLGGINLHDISCTSRAYRRAILSKISFEDRYDLFFVPYMLYRYTNKIAEVKVRHNPRKKGKSKYPFMKTCFNVVLRYIKLVISGR